MKDLCYPVRLAGRLLPAVLALALTACGASHRPPASAPAATATPEPARPDAAAGRESALSLHARGAARELAGDLPGAVELARQAVRADPRSPYLRLRLAQLALKLADALQLEEARQEMLRTALQAADDGLLLVPKDSALADARIEALLRLGDARRAEQELAELFARQRDPEHGLQLARLRRAMSDPAGAAGVLEGLASQAGAGPLVLAQLAGAYVEMGCLKEAEEIYRRLVAERPGDSAARTRLADLYARSGRDELAAAELEQALASDPGAAEARFLLAEILTRRPAPEAVERVLEPLLEEPRFRYGSLAQIALAYRSAGRIDEARVFWDLIADERPSDLEAQLAAAALASESGDEAAAEERCRRVLALDPDNVGALECVARGLLSQGRPEAAIGLIQAALARRPDSVELHLVLARLLGDAGDHAAAERLLRRAAVLAPASAAVQLALAMELESTGRWREAVAIGRRLLAERRDDPEILNFVGYVMADRGVELAEALELTRRAVALEPDNGAFVDSLGWALLALGQAEESTATLERAVALVPRDPVVREHLGDAYLAAGRREEALAAWRRALELGADSPELQAKIAGLE